MFNHRDNEEYKKMKKKKKKEYDTQVKRGNNIPFLRMANANAIANIDWQKTHAHQPTSTES